MSKNEAPRSPALAGRGIKAKFAEATRLRKPVGDGPASARRLTIHPCNKLQGILAKANKGVYTLESPKGKP